MRILRSIHTVNPELGGPIESVMQSSGALIGRGHEVEIVSLDRPKDDWVRHCALKVHALGPGRGNYGYARRFTRWMNERHGAYEAVIVHGLWQYNSLGVWRVLRKTSTPFFVFPHGMLDPWFKRAYPLKHLKKLLYWSLAESRVLRDAAAVLFTSEEERRLARDSFPFYRCNEVVVNYGTALPNVDFDRAREGFFTRFPQLRGQRFLLFLGRLHEKKGCELLIDAFASRAGSWRGDRSLELVIAGPSGDKGYVEYLQQKASSLSGVTFTGMLTGSCKWGAFSAADAFMLPSHQENFGIAVVEALACGTPVLISNKINIWREIASDNAGYVEDDDLAGATRLIERWVRVSADDRATMKMSAKDCFMRRFEIGRATDSLLAVLDRCVQADDRVTCKESE